MSRGKSSSKRKNRVRSAQYTKKVGGASRPSSQPATLGTSLQVQYGDLVSPTDIVPLPQNVGDGTYGYKDGISSVARFKSPKGIAIDSAGNTYVADTDNNCIRMITPTGTVTTIAGSANATPATTAEWSVDGDGTLARFRSPAALCLDSIGNIYVSDTGNHTVRMIKVSGTTYTVSTIAGTAGTASTSKLNTPMGICIDLAGNLYVADSGNHCIQKLVSGTPWTMSTFAGTAGTASLASTTTIANTATLKASVQFNNPRGITINPNSTILYVADTGNNIIRSIPMDTGLVITVAGSGVANMTSAIISENGQIGLAAKFNKPCAIASDLNENLYVCDLGTNLLRIIEKGGKTSNLIFNNYSSNFPEGIACDLAGNIYLANTQSNTIIINKLIVSEQSRFIGYETSPAPSVNDNMIPNFPNTIKMDNFAFNLPPTGICIYNNTIYITDISSLYMCKNNTITRIAGVNNALGNSGNGNYISPTNALISRWSRMCYPTLDMSGNIFILDNPYAPPSPYNIKRIDTNGNVSLVCGRNWAGMYDINKGVYSSGSNGTSDILSDAPSFVPTFTADEAINGRWQVPGEVSTDATGSNFSPNSLHFPHHLAINNKNELFIADNMCIYKIVWDPTYTVPNSKTLLAGTPSKGAWKQTVFIGNYRTQTTDKLQYQSAYPASQASIIANPLIASVANNKTTNPSGMKMVNTGGSANSIYCYAVGICINKLTNDMYIFEADSTIRKYDATTQEYSYWAGTCTKKINSNPNAWGVYPVSNYSNSEGIGLYAQFGIAFGGNCINSNYTKLFFLSYDGTVTANSAVMPVINKICVRTINLDTAESKILNILDYSVQTPVAYTVSSAGSLNVAFANPFYAGNPCNIATDVFDNIYLLYSSHAIPNPTTPTVTIPGKVIIFYKNGGYVGGADDAEFYSGEPTGLYSVLKKPQLNNPKPLLTDVVRSITPYKSKKKKRRNKIERT